MVATAHLPTDNPNAVAPTSFDDGSLKEGVGTVGVKDKGTEDCPDGGLRAWLVVFGVGRGYIVHRSGQS